MRFKFEECKHEIGTKLANGFKNHRTAKALAILVGATLTVAFTVKATTAQESSEKQAVAASDGAAAPTTKPAVETLPFTLSDFGPDSVTNTAATNSTATNTAASNTTVSGADSAEPMPATPVVAAQSTPDQAAPAVPTDAPSQPKVIVAAATRPAADGSNSDSPIVSSTAPVKADANGQIVTDGTDHSGRVKLAVNKSAVLTTKVPYKRVSVGQPDVADVNPIGPGNILITAKKVGSTQVIIWDDNDRSQVIDISVEFDIQAMQDQLKTMFPDSQIEATTLNGAIALRGRVPSLAVAEQAVAVASPFSNKVLNFLEVSGGQQVMLQVRFAEVSRSAASQLGVNFNYASGAFTGGSNIGQVNPFTTLPAGTVGDTPPAGGITRAAGTAINPAVTVFGAGQIGNFYLEYFLDALRQNNLLRMLAEPNLIASSGQEASFLAGGEFPVPVTQGGGTGGVAISVEYREFGVRLKMTPVVLGNGRIRLKVAPEVSDLDFTTAVRLNGFVIPGLTSRKVETSVELGEGQTFAIAGLLNNSVTSTKDVTPLLGDLPVVGALFRSVRYQKKETELVVLVTPKLVSGMNPDQVPVLPGEKWRDPSEAELFFNRDIGREEDAADPKKGTTTPPGTATADRTPSRYRGSYGFAPSTQPVASVAAESDR